MAGPRSIRNQLAEAFIRGVEAGSESPEIAGDGDAMYEEFRRWILAHCDGSWSCASRVHEFGCYRSEVGDEYAPPAFTAARANPQEPIARRQGDA